MGEVPCGSCSECCRGPGRELALGEADLAAIEGSRWRIRWTVEHLPDGRVLLGSDEGGTCLHLGAGGCRVYEDRPPVCRAFDCRTLVEHPGLPERVRAVAVRLLADGGMVAAAVPGDGSSHPPMDCS